MYILITFLILLSKFRSSIYSHYRYKYLIIDHFKILENLNVFVETLLGLRN